MSNMYTDMQRFLHAEVPGHHMTVVEYLDRLTASVWESFGDEKYGWTGSSDWRDDLYQTLSGIGLLDWRDEQGPTDEAFNVADAFITTAIQSRHTLERS